MNQVTFYNINIYLSCNLSEEIKTKMTNENNKNEPTLKDMMLSLASIKSTVDGMNNRICSQMREIELKVVSLEESQEFLSKRYEEQDRNINEIKSTNSRLQKENEVLWSKINSIIKGLAEEQVKRNNLEQYDRREMLEISGIPQKTDENCIDLVHKVCALASVDIKKKKIEIAHRMKNGDIIVKFTDHPTRDQLYAKQANLKEKSIKDMGFQNETSIYLNESLLFDTKGLLYEVRKKCKTLGYKKIITDNGIIKVKINNNTKWEKISN